MSASEDTAEAILEVVESVFKEASDCLSSISNRVEDVKESVSEVLEIFFTESVQKSVLDVFSKVSKTTNDCIETILEEISNFDGSRYNIGDCNISDELYVCEHKSSTIVDEVFNSGILNGCGGLIRLERANLLGIEINVSVVNSNCVACIVSAIDCSLGGHVSCICNFS